MTPLRSARLPTFKTRTVNKVVPPVLVPLTVAAVIGTFVGTRMTESSELTLFSVPARFGTLTIGNGAPVVTTFGRRVVLLV